MRKQKKFHFIYKTTNLLSGRYYIGMHSTNDLDDAYLGSGTYLRRSLNKHSKENHKREILEFCKTRKELKSREQEIVNLNEIAKKDCMNLKVGGSGGFHGIHTSETREKMSKNNGRHWKYNRMSDKTREKIRNTLMGHIVSDATKEKISKATIGKSHKPMSDETKRKIGKANLGKTVSDETKEKLRKANLGRKHTQETINKLSGINNHNFGKPRTTETKKKISESILGQTRSLQTRKNISAALINKNIKSVQQYSIDGEFIREWESIKLAAFTLKSNPHHISNCCNHKRKTTGGYRWAFVK